MTRHIFGAIALWASVTLCACVPPQQAASEAANAADDAAYSAEIDACGTQAIALWQTSAQSDADFQAASNLYATCAAGVDKKYGKTPATDAGAGGG